MTILYGSFSHTIWSVLMIFLSIGSFFLIFYLLSSMGLPTLESLFEQTIMFPAFFLNLLFFLTFTLPIDRFLYFIDKWAREEIYYQEKQKKLDEKKKFTKGLDPNKLAPIHRCINHSVFINFLVYRYWLCFQWRGRSCALDYRETNKSHDEAYGCLEVSASY